MSAPTAAEITAAIIALEDNPPSQGERGIQGVEGKAGLDGNHGRDGSDGKAGLDGANGTDGKDGSDGSDGQDGVDGQSINWRGPWVRGTYLPLDAVEYDGSSYIATSLTRTKPPGKGWDLMAQKGKDGGVSGGYNVRGFASGMVVDDEGVRLNSGAVIGEIDFAGAGVTATMSGGKALITIPGGGGGSSLTVLDEGVVLDTAVTSIDIVGNLTATNIGHAVTITAPADAVDSVNGQIGVVVLDASDVGAVPGPQVVFVQPSDPGAVGAGALWVDTTTPGTSDKHISRRNASDDGWDDILNPYNASGAIELTTSGFGADLYMEGGFGAFLSGGGDGFGDDGASLSVGAGNGAGTGGEMDFNGGDSVGGTKGARVNVLGGSDGGGSLGTGVGGLLDLLGGSGSFGSGGDGGSASLRGGGGNIGGAGGDLILGPGAGEGAGVNGALKLTDSAQSTGSAGQVLTAQGDDTALWADAAVWTETEVDFGTEPAWSATFTVTDALVSGASKIVCTPSGNPATGRVGNDLEWDNLLLGGIPGAGSFTLTALAMPGPIVGPRKVFYQVT